MWNKLKFFLWKLTNNNSFQSVRLFNRLYSRLYPKIDYEKKPDFHYLYNIIYTTSVVATKQWYMWRPIKQWYMCRLRFLKMHSLIILISASTSYLYYERIAIYIFIWSPYASFISYFLTMASKLVKAIFLFQFQCRRSGNSGFFLRFSNKNV